MRLVPSVGVLFLIPSGVLAQTTGNATPTAASPAPPGVESATTPPSEKPVATDKVVRQEPAPGNPGLPSGQFSFGSYGRVVAASDLNGRPGRDADIVSHGSRLDESNYVELELRRDDKWQATNSETRVVATLAIGNPIFHYSGNFDAKIGVRNLYIEGHDLPLPGVSVWAGSRMLRGDDIYLLDYWPLDNLNTLGAGAGFHFNKTDASVHVGFSQPENDFFYETAERSPVFNQWGSTSVEILNRQTLVLSGRLAHVLPLVQKAGLKGVLYGELHRLPSGQRETADNVYESLPQETGAVIGLQLGAFTGVRDTHVNAFVRYASGIAAYGQFPNPTVLGLDRTTSGAHELVVAASGNWELGPMGVMLGASLRSFRNSSEPLDYEDIDEGIVALRPHLFVTEKFGVAVEGVYEAVERGVLERADNGATLLGPLLARVARVGVIPFLSPAGRGDYSRPQIRAMWVMSVRNDAASDLYPADDMFHERSIEHFFGIGAEWWFNSSSYGG